MAETVYLIISLGFFPLFLSCLFYMVIKLTNEGKEKLISISVFIFTLILDIIFLYLLITQPGSVGYLLSPVDVVYLGYAKFYAIFPWDYSGSVVLFSLLKCLRNQRQN